ncbi:MAG TPA: hypothetical protein VM487_14645, partial [Phycisphaerae bacterium]|nr:hypothetical protein [Phycisphaerae bacterium]
MNTNGLRIVLSAALLVLAVCLPAAAADFELAVTMADVDDDACAAFHNGEKAPFDAEDVYATLGFPKTQGAWSAGTVSKPWTEETFQYRLAFVRPVEIGSVMLSAGTLALLKDDAAYPGDPAVAEQWVKPDVPPNQSGARLVPLPPGGDRGGRMKTRALLITDVRRHGRSQLDFVRIFSPRLHNITPAALANADAEYTVYPSMAPPHTYAAADVIRGSGRWMNAGKDDRGRNLRPPTSDVHPAWFVLSWKTRQTITGLWLLDDFASVRFYQFVGPDSVNPAIGTEQEWKKLDVAQSIRGGRWVSFGPVSTRGIKMLILKTSDPQVSWIDGLHVFTDLGEAPAPVTKPAVVRDLEPYRIPYTLPDDGLFTMVVDSSEGIRLRNIVARVERSKAENADFWDLKDENNQFVEPGTCTWKGIWHKPLKLRYEMTPYPNIIDNTPENSPWLTGHNGAGGWMADHTPPRAVCTAGDRVYFGAPCAESGVSFIECDLTGKKLWGYHSFAAWTGPQYLASDGTNIYVGAGGGEVDRLWAVNIETKQVSSIGDFPATTMRTRGLRGIAATGAVAAHGKLFVAVDGGESYLTGAASAADVDIESCAPLYVKKRPPRYDHEIVPDPR